MLPETTPDGSVIEAYPLPYQLFVLWVGLAGLSVAGAPVLVEHVLGVVLPATAATRMVALALAVPGKVYAGLVVCSILPTVARNVPLIGGNVLLVLLWEAMFGE